MIAISPRTGAKIVRHTFEGLPGSVGKAREWAETRLQELGIKVPDQFMLVLSELATNSIKHTRSGLDGGMFAVRLFVHPDRVRIEVRDDGPLSGRIPIRRTPRLTALDGRGLFLVEEFSTTWGRLRAGMGVFAEVPR
ncbi:histidine kinase-like protein [Nocardiopsis sp. Huas11]|uniref:ATP-binding protein n=1 Tax=Nocardiopsis sp. Huas11 TaxID=2183912 RepID=UPI000EACC591|nr:ATP-binding protein [Nocardiopsis sp. Huas11]RKS04993.1 histidine kinase-like protein [Nocardiopsis sp. Huas11]